MKHTLRVIGGRYRGKKFIFLPASNLRPTPNRVRETLFNWLMYHIQDACCLDAFSGSGSLGFEALSRGAAQIILLEQCKVTWLQLKRNAETFHAPQLAVLCADAKHYLQSTAEMFDIIFLDPPFAQPDLLYACVNILMQRSVLKPGGLLYTESSQVLTLDETHWQCLKSKKSGQVVYALYQKLMLKRY